MKMRKDIKTLIVEDDPHVAEMLQSLLEELGYAVVGKAVDGLQAIEQARRLKPDIILMDVIMPGLNGFQATRILRKEDATRDIPIIIVSGNEQATEKFWGLRIGANGFLAKPVDR